MFLCPLPPFFGQKSPPKSVNRHKARQSATKRESGQKCVNQETLSHFHTFTLSHFHNFLLSHFHTFILSHFHTFTTLATLLIQEQRKAENEGVTEDDVNEIKNDISAFRWPTMTMPMMLTMTMTVMMLSTAMTMKMTMAMLAILLTMLIKTGWHILYDIEER